MPKRSLAKVILSDGSVVTINAGSRLEYPPEFGKKSRNVYLTGEAYFEVAHAKGKSFIVHTKELEIEALGTEFNVRAYPDDKIVEALLVKGKIAVNSKISENETPVI